MKRALRTKSVGTKVSEAELRVLESRAASAGLTLSQIEEQSFRHESNLPVPGLVVVAAKP